MMRCGPRHLPSFLLACAWLLASSCGRMRPAPEPSAAARGAVIAAASPAARLLERKRGASCAEFFRRELPLPQEAPARAGDPCSVLDEPEAEQPRGGAVPRKEDEAHGRGLYKILRPRVLEWHHQPRLPKEKECNEQRCMALEESSPRLRLDHITT